MHTPDDAIENNPLWEYSNRVYRRQGVEQACLELQDAYAVDVNLLLYAAWLAQLGLRLDAAHLEAVQAGTAEWRTSVIAPLRALRRALRAVPAAGDIREGIQRLELCAEQRQQAMLYTSYRQSPHFEPLQSLEDNLALVARAASPAALDWLPGVRQLASLLDG